MSFKEEPGGIRREIVKEYTQRGGATVIPSAHRDDQGSRDDLNSQTLLTEPLIDPGVGDLVEAYDRPQFKTVSDPTQTAKTSQRSNTGSQQANNGFRYKEVPSVPDPTANKAPKQEVHMNEELKRLFEQTATDKTAGVHNTTYTSPFQAPPLSSSDKDDKDEQIDRLNKTIGHLLDIVGFEGRSPYDPTRELPTTVADHDKQPLKSVDPVSVKLSGKFGKFYTRVWNVKICDNHVALIYGRGTGDDTMAFEPPEGEAFEITVPYEGDKEVKKVVANFGLITKIPGTEIVVVVFPFANELKSQDNTSAYNQREGLPYEETEYRNTEGDEMFPMF